jgi:branched-chain amino acid transport system substrate-binding protein
VINVKRRLLSAVAVAAACSVFDASAQAGKPAPAEVKVGLIVPLSGPWARQGEMMLKGARMAVQDVNSSGGIKALGGAKLKLVTADAGDNIEKAKNAAQRLVSQEPDMIGATGAWASSFTLAVTEVTERAGLPFLTVSYADQITSRGYKNVFQTSISMGRLSANMFPAMLEFAKTASGHEIKTVGMISESNVLTAEMSKLIRETEVRKYGVKLVLDEVYSPPMSDATSLVQKLRKAKPDLFLLYAGNIGDAKLMLEKMNELGVGKNAFPVIGMGAHLGTPELLRMVGKDNLEGLMSVVANWGGKGHQKLAADFKAREGEPWLTQDAMSTYGDIWAFKETLEKAGVADRAKVSEALRTMNKDGGAAAFYAGGRLKFDETGKREGAELRIIQWQNGEPVTVYPASAAVTTAAWPKH